MRASHISQLPDTLIVSVLVAAVWEDAFFWAIALELTITANNAVNRNLMVFIFSEVDWFLKKNNNGAVKRVQSHLLTRISEKTIQIRKTQMASSRTAVFGSLSLGGLSAHDGLEELLVFHKNATGTVKTCISLTGVFFHWKKEGL
jgi:hypothetical protein